MPVDERSPTILWITNKRTQTNGDSGVILHIWEETFPEALEIMSRILPCQFESVTTIDEKRVLV
jgi:hypothetical protein